MRTRILLSILLPLCSAAPLDIAHEDKIDAKAHDDRTHSCEGSNTADLARVQKSISVSEIQMGDINLESFAGDYMSVSIGHKLEIGAHGHTGHAHAANTHEHKSRGQDPDVHDTGCPADKTITSECMCGGNSCALGSVCVSGSTCTPGCPADKTITSECMCGGNSCAKGGVCVSGSTCTPGCPTDETIISKCMCGDKSCAKGGVCSSDSTCTPALHVVLRILGVIVHTMKESKQVSVDDQNVSNDETAILETIATTKEYLEECFDKENMDCQSKKLWPLSQKLVSTFKKIQDKKVSSSFLAKFLDINEGIPFLFNLVEKVRDHLNPPETFTACGSECSCASETCKEDQMCKDYKCLSVCEHSLEDLLTDECFCVNDGKGYLCSKDSLCSRHGCLTDPQAFFWFLG